ncbi:hypothetical protein Celaphus_00012099 [Cervus elaphus hippelaphus]|uniref:Uncharacterized protein n=1 Tax=Cervus elaphus hippelaphus TaxID=46360 RepID=A0A212CL06_CEREH|nr:hypothetical protein Celaphus_00012099 [Cervus elaphus hippelaphus]
MRLRRALGGFTGADIRGDYSWVCCTFPEPTSKLQSCRESGGHLRARDVQGKNSKGPRPFLLLIPRKGHNAKEKRCPSETPSTLDEKNALKRLGLN